MTIAQGVAEPADDFGFYTDPEVICGGKVVLGGGCDDYDTKVVVFVGGQRAMLSQMLDQLTGDPYDYANTRELADSVRELVDSSGELFARLDDSELEEVVNILVDEYTTGY